MRKFTLLLLVVFTSLVSTAGIIYVPLNESDNPKNGKQGSNAELEVLDAKAFLALTPAKVHEMTGLKMSFAQKVSLRIAQNKVKKNPAFLNKINYDTFRVNDDRKFHWSTWAAFGCGLAAFLLLFFSIPAIVFGIIGIIKAGPKKKYRGSGLAIAGLILGALGLLIWLVVAAAIIAGF